MEPLCSICRQKYPPTRHEAYILLNDILPQVIIMPILEYDIPTEDFYQFGGKRFDSREDTILYCEYLLQGSSCEFTSTSQHFNILKDIFQNFHAYPVINPMSIGIKQPPLPSELKVFYYVPLVHKPAQKKTLWNSFRKPKVVEWKRLINYKECLHSNHFPRSK